MLEIPSNPVKSVAKFVERKMIADTVYEFRFEMVDPTALNFLAGQYIALEIDAKTRRQYSISSSPVESKTQFELIVDITPNGIGTKYLMNLNKGDEIKFIGQIGLFVLPEDLSENLFFIATGAGLAPLKSMIETLIANREYKNHNIWLYFGTRYINDIFYEELFNRYFNESFIKEYRICLSRASMPGALDGYVTQFIDLHPPEVLSDSQFFLCGSGNMIHTVEKALIKEDIPKDSIYYEKFY